MSISNKAKVVLEDGKVFEGFSFGASGTRFGEVVFNTSLSGYQEILTDPSYKGQIVTMTYPLIGNYGINEDDAESRRPFLEGFIVKECSRTVSNWRATKSLPQYLKENNIIGIEGIDTRALTKHIRLKGAMRVVVSTEDLDDKSLIKKVKASRSLIGLDLVKEVSIDKKYIWQEARCEGLKKIVAIDCGIKFNILRNLAKYGCEVTVVPANTAAEIIMSYKPQGLLISNGPGDPEGVPYVVDTVKRLIGKLPILGICFGHQLLGLALGGKTYKLKFGHHGGNHPVKDLNTGKVAITTQNHGFCVDIESLNKNDIEITHINLNDNTLEGMRHKRLPIFSVQFHPEHGPGPHDAEYLFDEFVKLM
ncbi:MAG: glutamine-hydrolyzing carbamoyl-phosphate synthase small subunit [Candidatus Omnitrophica bacterium]|jgi:carbamoyl-phosphate synthase small subunit|nr:glutamine-hydrolyzing carbamoyl-phosphate synthase small subunit [Candidatus Omnitrophota bacterium]